MANFIMEDDEKPITIECRRCHQLLVFLYSETDHGKTRCPNCNEDYGQTDIVALTKDR